VLHRGSSEEASRLFRSPSKPPRASAVVLTGIAAGMLASTLAISWWVPIGILVVGGALSLASLWIRLLARRDPRALVALWVILALNVPLALVVPPLFEPSMTRLDDIALAVALAVVLLTRRALPVTNLWSTVAMAGLALFAVSGIVSGLSEKVSTQALLIGTWLGAKFLVCAYIATRFRWAAGEIQAAYRVAMWLLGFIIVVAVVQLLAPHAVAAVLGPEHRERLGVAVTTSIFRVPAQYSTFTILGLCLVLAWAPLTRRRVAGAAVVGAAALLSLRLKALVDVVLAFTVRAAASPARSVRASTPILLVAAAAAAGYFGANLINERIGALFGSEGNAPRQMLYAVAADLASSRRPLGAGFGSFGSEASISYYSPVYEEYGLSSTYGFTREASTFIHDASWATVLGESGWLGAVGFAAALAALAVLLWQSTRTLPGDVYRAGARAGLLFLTVYVADSFANPQLFAGFASMSLAVLWSMALGPGCVAPVGRLGPYMSSATGASNHVGRYG
jgi:hypothetical protein